MTDSWRIDTRLAILLIVAVCAACGGGSPTQPTSRGGPPSSDASPPSPAPQPPAPPPPPRLSATRFVAFGDSLTEGVLSRPSLGLFEAPAFSYPTKLHDMLAARYPAQTLLVLNEGKAGERAEQGVERLPGVLRSAQPEVLLLMEGANDLNTYGRAGIPRAALAIATMVKGARAVGVQVMLATLPPQRPGGRSAGAAGFLGEYNDLVRRVAADDGAILVDVFAAYGGDLSLLGADGLHPTEAGYLRIAETFFAAIVTRLELPAETLTGPQP